jgi:hypothetical protein
MTQHMTGVRGVISEPAEQGDASGGTVRFYWIGFTLNAGDFLQGGYSDPPSSTCPTGQKLWFFQAWNNAGHIVSSPLGGCGFINSHEFRVAYEGIVAPYYKFVFRIDGANVQGILNGGPTSILSSQAWAYGDKLQAISEPSSTNGNLPAEPNPVMASVTYSPALQYYNCFSVCGWGNIASAKVFRYLTNCPPSNMSMIAANNIFAYWQNGGLCYSNGQVLW